jgi:hypothetical protein
MLLNAPINALYFSNPGASNIGNSVRIYTKNWQLLKTLNRPLNEYQSNN